MKIPLIAVLPLLIAGYVHADATDTQPPDMDFYINAGSGSATQNDARTDMLRQTAFQLGYQSGKARRAWELVSVLKTREARLNALYDFRTLISSDGWLPPVIDEAKDVANITPDQIRTASHVYKIISPERFVSNPPSWRKWLMAGLTTTQPGIPGGSLTPKNGAEEEVWKVAIGAGWEKGREGADHILEANFNRLIRDYRGMLLYSSLLRKGFISRPQISDEQQTVSGNRQQLVTGDRVRRMKSHAAFSVNKKHWKPVINTETRHAP